MLTLPILNELPGIRHAFFTREGGVSQGIYASLNCGPGSHDKGEDVDENRKRATAFFHLPPERLHTLYQIHSDRVITVSDKKAPDTRPQGDAMVTGEPSVVLGILTADCVPVLFADPKAGVIGAAHAGWKGALGGVLERTLEAMTDLGARADNVAVAIGPAIAQRSYEVGPEFPAPFLAEDADNADLFAAAPKSGHFLFDLKGFVTRRLHRLGVSGVDMLPSDTYSEAARFYSYRRACHRGEKDYGRLLSAICLED